MGAFNFGILQYKGMVYMSLITFRVPSVVCCALGFLVDSANRRDPSPTRCTKGKPKEFVLCSQLGNN